MKNMALAALVLGMSMSTAALADAGMYMALDAGRATYKDVCNAVPATVTCKNTDTFVRIAAGYNFSQLWRIFTPGVEIGYADLGQAKFSGTSLGVPVSGGFKGRALQVEATGSLALGAGFSIIAKLGVVEAYSKLDAGVRGFGMPGTSNTRTNAACAIGGQYDFNRNIGIRAQYENLRTFGDSMAAGETNVHLSSAGLVYRF